MLVGVGLFGFTLLKFIRKVYDMRVHPESIDEVEADNYIRENYKSIIRNCFTNQYVVTSQNRKYAEKRIDKLVKDGWKLKSQNVDRDGFIRSVMVK